MSRYIKPPSPFFDAIQVRYVAPAPLGNNKNGGYSARHPKETLLAYNDGQGNLPGAYDSLPARGGIIRASGGFYVGGTVPGVGFRLSDAAAFYGYPGWVATKPLIVEGLGAGPFNGLFSRPCAWMISGQPGVSGHPTDRQDVGVWVYENNNPILFRNIIWSNNAVSCRLGVDGNPSLDPDARANRNHTVSNVWFESCSFSTTNGGDGRDCGPACDIGYVIFQSFKDCNATSNQDQDYLSDRRASWLFKSGAGTAPQGVLKGDCTAAQGGIKYYAGGGSWGLVVDNFLVESNNSNLAPPVKILEAGPLGSAVLTSVGSADATNNPPAVDTTESPNMPPSCCVLVSGGGALTAGKMLVLGGYNGANAIDGQTPPYFKDQMALLANKYIGDLDNVRFNTPVITNRVYNMVPMRDGSQGIVGNVINPPDVSHSNRIWTQLGATGTDTVNAPIADRKGSNTAIRISSKDGTTNALQRFFYHDQNAAAGDIWVCAGWVRTTSLFPGALGFTAVQSSGTVTFSGDTSGPDFTPDGQWQFVKVKAQVLTATGGATATINFNVQATPAIPVDLDGLLCAKIAAGTMSPFEFGQFYQNLVSYVQAPQGAAVTQPGQLLYADGGLGVGNAVAATTLGSVVKKVPLLLADGTTIYVAGYDHIT